MTKKKSYRRPKPPLGPYTKPRVAIVKLDPEQAILSACRVAGDGFMAGAYCRYDAASGQCGAPGVRGVHGHAGGGLVEWRERPS